MSPARKLRRYAEGTNVSVDTSRSELEKLLNRAGATSFGVYREPTRWVVIFQIENRHVRHVITIPTAKRNGPDPEKEVKRRWRALLLITRAKLEAIAGGDSTIDREFLADTVLADGLTVYEATKASIAESYETGVTPRLLLGPGGA